MGWGRRYDSDGGGPIDSLFDRQEDPGKERLHRAWFGFTQLSASAEFSIFGEGSKDKRFLQHFIDSCEGAVSRRTEMGIARAVHTVLRKDSVVDLETFYTALNAYLSRKPGPLSEAREELVSLREGIERELTRRACGDEARKTLGK